MPPLLSWLSTLIAACVASAWAIAIGWPRRPPAPLYRPVAWLLSLHLGADLARAALQAWVLRPARAATGVPYTGAPAAVYHLEQALHLAWPVALVAAALAVFVRRRPWWPVLGAWAALAGGFAAAYPELRLGARDKAHAVVSTVAIVGVAACAAVGWRRAWRRREAWGTARWALGWIGAIELAVLAVVLWWPAPGEHWEIARRVQQVGYGCLLGYQVAEIVRRR